MSPAASAQLTATSWTYQGELRSGEHLASGTADLRFSLYGEPEGSVPLLPAIDRAAVTLQEGRFSVALDFGFVWATPGEKWLEIQVRSSGTSEFQTLAPRQPITPAPLALYALNGRPGPMGPPGVQGPAGPQGPQGPVGASPFKANGGSVTLLDGSLGIGVINPEEKLHVAGTILATSIRIQPTVRYQSISGAAFRSTDPQRGTVAVDIFRVSPPATGWMIFQSPSFTMDAIANLQLPDGAELIEARMPIRGGNFGQIYVYSISMGTGAMTTVGFGETRVGGDVIVGEFAGGAVNNGISAYMVRIVGNAASFGPVRIQYIVKSPLP